MDVFSWLARAYARRFKGRRPKLIQAGAAAAEAWASARNLLEQGKIKASPIIEFAELGKGKGAGKLTLTRSLTAAGASAFHLELMVGRSVVISGEVPAALVAEAIAFEVSPLAAALALHPKILQAASEALLPPKKLAAFQSDELKAAAKEVRAISTGKPRRL